MMEGDQVYARNFSQGSKWVPGKETQSNSPTTFEVALKDDERGEAIKSN